MSLRPRKEEPPARGFSLLASGGLVPPAPTSAQAGLSFDVSDVGAALRTVAPSPYNDKAHLEPREFEDHDGGPWEEAPRAQPKFEAVPQKWVVAPALGSQAPAICVFPRRLSNNISFAPDVHLSFSAVWTPIIARFTNLFLTDVVRGLHTPPLQSNTQIIFILLLTQLSIFLTGQEGQHAGQGAAAALAVHF